MTHESSNGMSYLGRASTLDTTTRVLYTTTVRQKEVATYADGMLFVDMASLLGLMTKTLGSVYDVERQQLAHALHGHAPMSKTNMEITRQ